MANKLKEIKLYRLVRPLIKVFILLVYRPKIEGRENIDDNDGIILAGNHTNNLDCVLLIASTKRTIRFLAKDSLNKGFKKFLFRGMGIIPVDRVNHNNSECIEEAESVLKNNGVIGIFPEGTINRTNDTIMEFKKGAVNFSKNTNKKIIPFVIKGKYKLFGGIRIRFYKPMEIDNNIDRYNDKLMQIIKSNLEDIWD
jgi:1-acyl-sn-glycerol-3-phosphate acyltransferase